MDLLKQKPLQIILKWKNSINMKKPSVSQLLSLLDKPALLYWQTNKDYKV